MKIVDRKAFLALPAGTVYAKYAPSYFEELCIKGETLPYNDWCEQDIVGSFHAKDSGEWSNLLDESLMTGKSLQMDFNIEARDGCFDDDQLFAVWEQRDVLALIARLLDAVMESA
jgi:hypothetical protein